MRRRALLAGLMAISTVVMPELAWAKASIAQANITGPGLRGDLIIASDTEGLWESGIDVQGGLDDDRADAVEELGLTSADLGPKYLVTYRFESSEDLIRQDLYPYAKKAPVTYTPPGQGLNVGIEMSIVVGWYQSSVGFFEYLVNQGLPATNPLATQELNEETSPGAQAMRSWVLVALALAVLSLAGLAVRHQTSSSLHN